MSAFSFSKSADGIAEIKFDLPGEKVNKFSVPILKELESLLDAVRDDSAIKVLKFTSGKENSFIAGADLHSFEPAFTDASQVAPIIHTGHQVFKKVSELPFPTVAIINGACMGGGCEFILSCSYRVATDNPKTLIGLPEVNLGIYPGWGGTQRLPRLIGLSEALGIILPGKVVPAYKAWKIHLVDALIPYEFQENSIKDFMGSIVTQEGSKKIIANRSKKSWLQKLMDNNPLGRSLVFNRAEKQLLEKTKGHYPAPLIALKLIKESFDLPLEKGLQMEADTFIRNVPKGFWQAPNLISLFFTQEALKKETGGALPRKISSSGVLGAGTMGASLAWLFASHAIFTRLKDMSWTLVGKGLEVVRDQLKKGLKAKKITPCQFDRAFQLVSGTIDYSGFQHADLVLEAATEDLELKKKIFKEVEAVIPNQAILASNTSSIRIDTMAEALNNPERFIGIHFFNPVPKMPLVEVVPGKKTSAETTSTVMEFCRTLGKTPIIVGDCAGFLVNRIFMIGAGEMMHMVQEGYSVESLNKATLDFGMPMGPLTLADEVGIDVIYKVALSLEKAYGERMQPNPILKEMVDRGFLGKKVGKGFYLYDKNHIKPNPEAFKLFKKNQNLPENEILPRFLYVMINEAARCLEEKIVQRPDYLDIALIMGTGFPPFRGGLLRYADTVGVSTIVSTLNEFTSKYGSRFTPSQALHDTHKFYE